MSHCKLFFIRKLEWWLLEHVCFKMSTSLRTNPVNIFAPAQAGREPEYVVVAFIEALSVVIQYL
jgi:hypothetical protein